MSVQEQLRQLFQLDQRVRGLRTRLDLALNREKAQQAKLDQLTRQRDELAGQVKLSKAKAGELENQVNEIDERISHLREQMNSVKNNKEYSALLIEVSTIKNDKGKIEEEALTQLSQVDMLSASLASTEEKAAEQKKILDIARQEVAARREEVGSQLDEATKDRDAALAMVPDDAKAQFHRQASIHDGEAVAVIVEENRRNLEYSCGGCYMGLPIERVNTTLSQPDSVVNCPSCGRILYAETELRKALGPKA
jgi:predicted  nucleic acid-binding Zn-ribbon protein